MKNLKSILVTAVVALISNFVSAQTEPVDKNGLAIGGYDVVAYFTTNTATKGTAAFIAENQGVTYHFSSVENLNEFKKNPSKYLPQTGGYCAWGVSEKNTKFPTNPETFKVINGKLYLFFDGDYNGSPFNTLTEWNKDEKKNLSTIDANWLKLKK
jgi:YHS domain-containing protein